MLLIPGWASNKCLYITLLITVHFFKAVLQGLANLSLKDFKTLLTGTTG